MKRNLKKSRHSLKWPPKNFCKIANRAARSRKTSSKKNSKAKKKVCRKDCKEKEP